MVLTCQSLAFSVESLRWSGQKVLYTSGGGVGLTHQTSRNVSFDVPLRQSVAIRGTNRFFSKHYCLSCLLSNFERTYQCLLVVKPNSLQYFVFNFPVISENLEMRGIDLRTSRMLRERSTVWVTTPLRTCRDNNKCSFSVIPTVEQTLPFISF